MDQAATIGGSEGASGCAIAHDCKSCGRRVPWLAFAGNLLLTFFKLIVGYLGGSPALIADGLHSFTDVIGTSVILASTRVSERPPDASHNYGYGKAEFMSATFIFVVLTVLGIIIFVGGALLLLRGNLHPPGWITFFAGIVSIIYNVLMYQLGQCAGKRTKSPALLANSFENRADGISSMAVCIGIVGAILIHPAADPIAAMVVGVVIFMNCMHELGKAMGGLMDKALPDYVTQRIRDVIVEQRGVTGLRFLRSRSTGGGVWLDLGVEVSAGLKAPEAEAIADEVRAALMQRSTHFENVSIYVVPQRSVTSDKE